MVGGAPPHCLDSGVSPRKLPLWIWREEAFAALDTAVSACVRGNVSVPENSCGSLPSYTLSV